MVTVRRAPSIIYLGEISFLDSRIESRYFIEGERPVLAANIVLVGVKEPMTNEIVGLCL